MQLEDFIKSCWDSVDEYITGVISGQIITNKWIKIAVTKFREDLKREDLEYRVESVDKVFSFFYFLNTPIVYSDIQLLSIICLVVYNLFQFSPFLFIFQRCSKVV